MASLLYPDEEQSQAPLSLLQPPDDRPPVLQPDPRADALGTVYQQVMDAMEAQRRVSAERGLWDDNTGLPTKAGLLDAIGQAGTAVALGTSAPGDAPPPGFTAYHGSPHQFDAFDLSKIGTGEGAQAYGHGMYLADAEALAQYYRKKLAGPRADYAGEIDPAFKAALKSEDYLGFDTPGQAIAAMRSHPDWAKRWDVEHPDALASGLAAHDTAKYGGQGHMYEVQVNADPERFLHWDKPLGEQPKVWERVAGRTDWTTPDMTGARLLGEIQKRARNDPVAAAQQLNEMGIPGIRYLDQASRGAGEGSYNSVIFDPKNMEIIRRYGLAGLMAGGGAAVMGGQQRQQQ